MTMRTFFILIIIATTLQSVSQHLELLPHFPVPQSGPQQFVEKVDLSTPPYFSTLHPVNRINKSSSNVLDTLYPVLHGTFFYDVMDSDSAYFISGIVFNRRYQNLDPDNPVMLLRMKVSYAGEVLWTHVDSLMRGDHFIYNNNKSLIKTVDGNYIQMGFVANDYNNWKDYMIRLPVYTKFNTDGDIIWQRLYTDTTGWRGGDWPQAFMPEDDGGFTVAALTPSVSKTYSLDTNIHFWYNDTTYVSLIRYDSLGNEVHRKSHVIGGDLIRMTIGLVMKQDDGGYVVGGLNRFFNWTNLRQYYLFKTDSLFNWEWIKKFSQSSSAAPVIEILPKDSFYIFAVCRSDSPVVIGARTYYWKYHQIGYMDPEFNIIHDTIFEIKLAQYGPTSYYLSGGKVVGLAYTSKENIVVAGAVGASSGANIMQLDSNLQFQWNRWLAYYPHRYWKERPYRMRAAHDGGYLIVGMTDVVGAGGWFVKTDTMGCALPNCADTLYHIGIETQERGIQQVFVYPNPTRDHLIIRTKDNSALPHGTLQIFNMQGALQKEIAIPKYQSHIQLNLSHLSSGLYLGRIVSNSGEGGGFRFVKE